MGATAADCRVAEEARAGIVTILPPVGALYLALGVLYLVAPPLAPGWIYAVTCLLVGAGQLLLAQCARVMRLALVHVGGVHIIGVVAALLAIAHALSFVALTGDPAQTVVLVIVILGAAFATLTHWAALTIVAAGLVGWMFVARDFPSQPFAHWGINLIGTSALALVTSTARIRALRRQIAIEHALRESEERHRLVVDGALDAIISVDTGGVVHGWNPQAERMFGWTAPEIVGRPVAASLLTAEHRESYERGVADFLATGMSSILHQLMEVTAVRRDGSTFTAEMTTVPMWNGDGWVFTAFVRDITTRKLAEDDLLRAKDDAEAGARVKSDFLATMSHEIRTPLNGIFGMTELALDTDDDGERREFLQRARVCAGGLMSLLNDVLDFSRVEAGRLELERIAFDPRDVVDGVLDALAVAADRKGLELIGCVDERLPATLVGDPGRLRQILTNLAGNALKFTERGEVVIRLSADPADDGGADEITLLGSVRDTGIGIDPDKQRTIFEAFTQADTSMTRRFGGSGLGLAISQRLVGLMQGTIGVDSTPGVGSRFWFTTRQGRDGPPIAAELPALDGRRVLIASTHPASACHLAHTLRAAGARPRIARTMANAETVIAGAARDGRGFDCLLVDLPTDLRDAAWHLVALEQAAIPFPALVVLTPIAARSDLARIRRLRPEVLSKPIKARALSTVLAAASAPARAPHEDRIYVETGG